MEENLTARRRTKQREKEPPLSFNHYTHFQCDIFQTAERRWRRRRRPPKNVHTDSSTRSRRNVFLKTFSNPFNLCRTPLFSFSAAIFIIGDHLHLGTLSALIDPWPLTSEYLLSSEFAVYGEDEEELRCASGGVIIELILCPPTVEVGAVGDVVDGCSPVSLIIIRWR